MLIVYALAAVGACSVARAILSVFDASGYSGKCRHWQDED